MKKQQTLRPCSIQASRLGSWQAGFTLIELLVVIAIIGLLSSVAMVSLNSARIKARDALRKADMAQIRTALYLYYDDNEAYPICSNWDSGADDYGASAEDGLGAACYLGALTNGLTGGSRPVMAKLPEDPRNPSNDYNISTSYLYRYVSTSDGDEYAMAYQLEEDPGVDQIFRGW